MENDEIDTPTGGESLTLDQAAAAYAKATAEPVSDDHGDTGEQDDSDTTTDDELQAADEDAGEDDDGETAEQDQAEDDKDEPESDQGRFVADNAKVRLPDGTVTTIAELKSGSLRNADYTQKTQALAEQRKSFEAQSEASKASKQHADQLISYATDIVRSVVGEPPPLSMTDPSSPDFDLVGYNFRKAQHEQWMQHLGYLQQQSDLSAKEKQDQAAKSERETADREWEALVAKVPELKDQKRVDRFVSDMREHASAYGIKPEELKAVALDHRQALILRDAIAWRKLQASKGKVEKKVEGRPPVQKGGKRLNPSETKARSVTDAMNRLRQTGRLEDAVAAYSLTQK